MLNFKGNRKAVAASVFVLLFLAGFLVGGLGLYYVNSRQIITLSNDLSELRSRIATISGTQNQTITNQTITVYQNGTDLSALYNNVKNSVVLIQGNTTTGGVQGSGFVYNYNGRNIVITNFHVAYGARSLSVTFSNGNGYAATILGNDSYADLAVLSVDAPAAEFMPLQIVSSSSLRVGDQVIAVGNPYGLVGSLTTGVVSALGRSIQEEEFAGGYSIPNIIQSSTPINPGNSGGPLLNAAGNVVGITTAILSESQGLGFAIPSNTILRELPALIETGTYASHAYLGIASQPGMADMDYNLAQRIGVNVTYGRYVGIVTAGGPAEDILQVEDIIIAMNQTKIRNSDDLGSYLAENCLPGDTVILTIVRDNETTTVNVVLGTRPPPDL